LNGTVDWTSATVILVAGLVLGALCVMFFRRRKSAPSINVDLQHKDLAAKRDVLLQQLRDPDLAPTERTRLELETAQVLRALDAHVPVTTATAPSAPAAMNSTVKGFIWGATSVAALVGLFYFVQQQSTPRQQGGPVTGAMNSTPQPQQAAQQAPDPMVMQLEAAVQRDPNNLQLHNDLAQAYLERDNLMAVFEQTKIVLAKSPNDSRALTFQGLVRMSMGETDTATRMLQQATKADPRNLDGWVALAWVYVQSNRMKEAEATVAQAIQQAPNDRARLEQVFEQMKQHAAQAAANPAPAAGGGELPPGHPSIDSASAAAAPVAAAPAASAMPGAVHVTINLDPAAATRSGIVFVIVRNPAGGPPIAVKRVLASAFPVTVDLSSADSMMGQQLPASFRLEARLDTDGDPLTHPPTDPKAAQEGVTPGASVSLALK
jgi:cytochrome c-type biogenesis protein CcmH/NrfG